MTSLSPSKATKEVTMTISHKKCSVAECRTRKNKARCTHGWFCSTHYHTMKTRGTPYFYNKNDKNIIIIRGNIGYIVIKNRLGQVLTLAKVDKDKVELVKNLKWMVNGSGHIMNTKTRTSLHHTVYGEKILLDHINRDPSDNRLVNLRHTTKSLNAANMFRDKQNTSGFKGVVQTPSKKWAARIKYMNNPIHIGTYETKLAAAKAYNDKAFELFGKHSLLNDLSNG